VWTLVQKTLAGAGLTLSVTKQSSEVHGSKVTYSASSLMISSAKLGVLTLGGVQLALDAGPAFTYPSPSSPAPAPVTGGQVSGGGTFPAVTLPGAQLAPGSFSTPQVAAQPPAAAQALPAPASAPVALHTGYSAAWLVLALLAALGLGLALRRIPGRVLAAPLASCAGEDSL
jgi:hypothetical protein